MHRRALLRAAAFLSLVHDLETATPLFLGRVTDPSR